MSKLTSYIQKHPAISLVLGFQLFRFLLLPFMGLMPQDAYYYFYGQHLSPSYFDHPGMIGYFLRIFTEVLGKSVFVIKLTDFIITSLTLLSFYKLTLCFLPKYKALRALVLICSTLFISIVSFNSTPDVPLLLFWTLSLISLYKAIFEQRKFHWILAGILMGLAFNSKYTSVLLQFGLLAFVLFSKQYRKLLASPWLWMSLIISVIVTFPVWWWNYQNDFASFTFQGSNRTGTISKFKITPNFFFGAIAHQLILLLPILFGVFISFIVKYFKRFFTKFKLPKAKSLFLLAFFVPTFVGFFLLTPIYWVKMNWMMPSYITGVIIAAMFISRKMIKAQVIISIVLHILVAAQILFYFIPIKSDDTWIGWKEITSETKKLQEEYPNTFIFSADDYKTSAVLDFYLDDKIYSQNIIGLQALHFDYIGDDLSKLNGKNAIFIDSDTRFKDSNKKNEFNHSQITEYFETVTELNPIIIKKNGKGIRKFWVYYCSNYQYKK